jgi:hypothetical protein
MEKVIDNVNVNVNKEISDNEINDYIHQVMKLDKGILTELNINIDDNFFIYRGFCLKKYTGLDYKIFIR